MREYTFKPAPVRKAQTWAIKDDHLMRRGGSKAVKLADIKAASWNTVTYRGTRSAWLHLQSEDGPTKIEYTDTGGARDEFFALIQGVAAGLGRVQPDLQIKVGHTPPWRMALFILGLAGTLFGLLLILAGLTDLTDHGAAETTVAGVQETIIGGAMCILLLPVAWSCRPNLKGETVTPDGFAEMISDLYGTPVADPEDDTRQA